jgi:hypothetical protein
VGADHGDAAPADAEQVLGRGARRLDVLHRDVVGRAAEDALAEQHEGEGDVEQVDVVLTEAFGAEQDAVGQPQTLAGERGELAVAGRAGLVDDDADVVHGGRPDDGIRQLGEIVLAQLGDRQADDSGLAGTQAAGREVRPVVELRDRGEHPLAGRRTHVGVVVDDVRNGLDRDAGNEGDVMKRRRHERSLSSRARPSLAALSPTSGRRLARCPLDTSAHVSNSFLQRWKYNVRNRAHGCTDKDVHAKGIDQ